MMQTDWKERWWKELKYGVRGEEKALRGSVEKQFGAQIKLILNVQELEFDSGIHRNMDFCQAPNILDMKWRIHDVVVFMCVAWVFVYIRVS